MADMETWLVVVDLANVVVTVGLAVGMSYLGLKQRELHSMKGELALQSRELVKAELNSHTTPLKASIDLLTKEIASIHGRLDEGEIDFKEIGDRRESMTLQLERRFSALREFLTEGFASKTDLKDHETSMGQKVGDVAKETVELGKQVAVLSDRMKA